MVYQWNRDKAATNLRKHGINFADAVSVFSDDLAITITDERLDDDVLTWFREQVHLAGGGNYQTLINETLRQHIQQKHEPLEETLRRVVREELDRIEK